MVLGFKIDVEIEVEIEFEIDKKFECVEIFEVILNWGGGVYWIWDCDLGSPIT